MPNGPVQASWTGPLTISRRSDYAPPVSFSRSACSASSEASEPAGAELGAALDGELAWLGLAVELE
jgi:hypothetical protein